jgi:uncharacterized membrane protein YbjE (DUF340 family)
MDRQELERDGGLERHHASESERVAQAVEHVTFNHGVEGSSPSALTKQNQSLSSKIKHQKRRPKTRCAHAMHTGGMVMVALIGITFGMLLGIIGRALLDRNRRLRQTAMRAAAN